MDETYTSGGAEELYGTKAIRENKLEPWPNPYPERPYFISFDIPEFTCLCPRSGFPDFALIKVRYQPRDWIVELRSLKLYINGYRDRAHLTRGGGESDPGRSRFAAPTPLDAGHRRLHRARQHQDGGEGGARHARATG